MIDEQTTFYTTDAVGGTELRWRKMTQPRKCWRLYKGQRCMGYVYRKPGVGFAVHCTFLTEQMIFESKKSAKAYLWTIVRLG